jgi:hypothetical protein
LLLEKVVAQELEEKVEISPEDVAAYYAEHYANRSEAAGGATEDADAQAGGETPLAAQKPLAVESINAAIVNHLRRSKAQEQYPAWIQNLQTRYGVTVDWDRWHRLTENLPPAARQGMGEGMRLVNPPETP